MKQCDYCGNYGEGLETVTIDSYYSDGSPETIDLCPEHLPKLDALYPPCPDDDTAAAPGADGGRAEP